MVSCTAASDQGPREAQAISEAPAEPALPGRRVRPLEGEAATRS